MKITVTSTKPTNTPGVIVHQLSNGMFVREDPRKGSYHFKLYTPGQAKEHDPKLLGSASTKRKILKMAERLSSGP
ncbi:hypothetical protein [Actinomadura rubrisoli]|uniref:Uncharacterized protein n=1 Tax=Actinomadura rubrisoli TaxID=2530368 RepID=A0A4R5CCH6_9ACTN|nr:hypothetical protein [Actinomadura rubrisoli]TDD97155.1 hypothetical protein E1298_01590 [Actinomadura rubrisoli]